MGLQRNIPQCLPLSFFLCLILTSQAFSQQENSHLQQGLEKHENRDYEGAIGDYTKALEQLGPQSDIYYIRGVAKSMVRDYEGAVDDLGKAIELEPGFVDAYFVRGIARIALGESDFGCLDLKKAEELGSEQAADMLEEFCSDSNE